MSCAVVNNFVFPYEPPPSFSSTSTANYSIFPPLRNHHTGKPLILHVGTRTYNRTPLCFSIQSLSLNGDGGDKIGGGGGSGRGGDGDSEGDDENNNSFKFEPNLFTFLSFRFVIDQVENKFSLFSGTASLPALGFASLASLIYFNVTSYAARAESGKHEENVFEVRGGRRVELVADYAKDEFLVADKMSPWWIKRGSSASPLNLGDVWSKCKDIAIRLLLPEGYPESVTSDYLEYSLWRGVQGVAAQISGVLATQALLYAVGLGKGAIPTAAAVNWVLKDGIGYLSKIMLSKYGRHFDVNPKGWRLFADFLENAAFGMEILTPAFPHLFVQIGAVAGAGRSAAALIQAATRSCFYAGFAAQRNFAEVIAKGEAQGMVSKSIGIMLGIALANAVQSSTPLALASFGVVTWIHMFCNLKSYQSIQLRTLNPYRASLVFSEYLLSGLVPSVKEVNNEEPVFPAFPLLIVKPQSEEQSEVLSTGAKDAASHIDRCLQLGSKLSDVVKSREDAVALIDLYKSEGYILTEVDGKYCVVLKESSTVQDMLKSLFQVCYLYWLERNAGIKSSTLTDDCRPGGRLQICLEYVQREFNHVKNDGELAGWTVDGLIARPLPNRVRVGNEAAVSLAAVT
ncbi:hypothetical protein ACS0TY_011822 [Phlomoides rotata]